MSESFAESPTAPGTPPGAPVTPAPGVATPAHLPARVGNYAVLGLLGRGGMGVVYLARDDKLGRRVALKAMTSPLLQNDKARERFHREVHAVARLSHPAIVPIYDVGEAEGVPFFTMECIDGRTLAEVLTALRQAQPAPAELTGLDLRQALGGDPGTTPVGEAWRRSYVESVCRLMLEVLEALAHAHEQGVVHRDVKPSNVLVTRDGRAHLFDFGLARMDADLALTRTGEFVGTPYYAAPEQLEGSRGGGDARSDVYAAGVTLYELLTLQVPFGGETPHQVFRQVLQQEPPPPRRRNAAVPRDLEMVVLTALDKDPARRYASARAFADDLRRFLEFRPVLAQPAGVVTRSLRWVRRNRPATVAGVLLLLLLLGGPLAYAALEHGYRRGLEQALATAREEEAQKTAALRRSEGLRLLAQSSLVLADNPGLALGLALEGHTRAPGLLANAALIEALDNLHEVRTLLGHGDRVLSVAVSADGARLLTTSADRTARVWDVATGRALLVLRGHEAAVLDGCFVAGQARVLTAGDDGTLRGWDERSGAPTGVLRGPGHGIQSLACSADGSRAVAVGGSVVWISALTSDAAPVFLRGHRGPVKQAVFSPDGTKVATGGADRTARLWDARSGAPLAVLEGHDGPVLGVAFSPDGALLATAAADRTVRVWALDSQPRPQLRTTLRGHDGWVTAVAFHPRGDVLLTGGMDRTLHLWQLAGDGVPLATLRGHTDGVTGVALTPDGRLAASAGMDGTVRLWQLPALPAPAVPMGAAAGAKALPPAAEVGSRAARPGTTVAMSADGRRVLTLEGEDGIRLRESGTLRELGVIRKRPGTRAAARFSQRGSEVVVVTGDGITLWDADKGAELRTLERHGARARSAALSPDGATLVIACEDGIARILDAHRGTLLRELGSRGAALLDAEFSADGTLVATATEDRLVRLFRVRDGQPLAVLRGHQGPVRSVAFAADGQRVVSVGADATVRVFACADGSELAVLPGHETDVSRASFDADGSHVRVLLASGKERRLPIDPPAVARARAPRALTPAERARFELPLAGTGG